MIESVAVVCLAGVLNVGPGLYQVDLWTPTDVITLRQVGEEYVEMFTADMPLCGPSHPFTLDR